MKPFKYYLAASLIISSFLAHASQAGGETDLSFTDKVEKEISEIKKRWAEFRAHYSNLSWRSRSYHRLNAGLSIPSIFMDENSYLLWIKILIQTVARDKKKGLLPPERIETKTLKERINFLFSSVDDPHQALAVLIALSAYERSTFSLPETSLGQFVDQDGKVIPEKLKSLIQAVERELPDNTAALSDLIKKHFPPILP